MAAGEWISRIEEKAMEGIPLDRSEIIALLKIPAASEDEIKLRQAAKRVSFAKTNGCAYIWSAVGADYAPCSMNCRFCSFGEQWGIVKNPVHYSPEQIMSRAANFVQKGAHFIVLRTTEFYSIPVLIEMAKKIRQNIPGEYEVVFNTGEIDLDTASDMVKAGVNGIYHACRLREGIDTPFALSVREATMSNVSRSELKLISLVEPIGSEHTNDEIADNFLRIVEYGAVISGAMARIPVPGTPLGNTEQISNDRLARIISVLRLAGGNTVRDICVHPATQEIVESGANVVVVETGAIPRDADCREGNWNGTGIEDARAMLSAAGYKIVTN